LYIYIRKSALDRPVVVKFLEFYLAEAGDLAARVGYVAVTDEIAEQSRATFAAAVEALAPPASN
jgi:phosphate transport system substrate-binding protein